MTHKEFIQRILAEGFEQHHNEFAKPGSSVFLLVNNDRIYVTLRYPHNGYWNLRETAQFPNRPAFRSSAFATVQDLVAQDEQA